MMAWSAPNLEAARDAPRAGVAGAGNSLNLRQPNRLPIDGLYVVAHFTMPAPSQVVDVLDQNPWAVGSAHQPVCATDPRWR